MKYNLIFKDKYSSWSELEARIETLPTAKECGDAFEEFVFAYFQLHQSLYQINQIYRINDVPLPLRKRYSLEKRDSGIDGIIVLQNGQVAAYQAKFRSRRGKPTYEELTKFWAEARDTDWHYTIANSYSLSKLCEKNKKHLSILVPDFENLGTSFFEELFKFTNLSKVETIHFAPDKFQRRMIDNVLAGFKEYDRGKLIAACGTGKTLTALWASEELNTHRILFIAPSLALIKQTLEAWAEQAKEKFTYLCVCSDRTVTEAIDDWDLTVSDLPFPVTTDHNNVKQFLASKTSGKQIIFSTYQSLDVIAKGIKQLGKYEFDLIIFDEAHRTAGAKDSTKFGIALDNSIIPSKKRLFMTATERLVRPWVIEKAKEYDRVVFSMNDESLYGPVFDRLNFGEAIKNQLISDYRIIVAGVRQREIYDWIRQNDLLVDIRKESEEYHTSAQNVFRQVMLIKAMQKYRIRKTITFHSSISQAKAFVSGHGETNLNLQKVFSILLPKLRSEYLYIDHVNGKMGAGDRAERMDAFKDHRFGVISNARCLTEGVDVPIIDSVYFVNPKNSLIDIVQACGRALRKPRDGSNKMAYFVVPILIPEGEFSAETINEIDFEMLHNLLQSLRDQDQRMEQWIDTINLQASKGGNGGGNGGDDGGGPIVFDLPHEFDIKQFEKQLYIRIAKFNGEPTRVTPIKTKYGKKERKSDIERIFKTLGDYALLSYENNLVMPTLKKFEDKNQILSVAKLSVNHNNISHTERLGLIVREGKGYKLSPLGVQLFEGKIKFNQVFSRQMLRYCSTVMDKDSTGPRVLFPYRTCLKILKEVKSINYPEFVFGLYSILDSSDESVRTAIETINIIRQNYPNIEILNKANQERVLNDLNESFGTSYSATDLWARRTTIVNQFIYFRNHLSVFDDIIKVTKEGIFLLPKTESKLENLLRNDNQLENMRDPSKLLLKYVEAFVLIMLVKLL